jgi:hypothetical protein
VQTFPGPKVFGGGRILYGGGPSGDFSHTKWACYIRPLPTLQRHLGRFSIPLLGKTSNRRLQSIWLCFPRFSGSQARLRPLPATGLPPHQNSEVANWRAHPSHGHGIRSTGEPTRPTVMSNGQHGQSTTFLPSPRGGPKPARGDCYRRLPVVDGA